MAKFTEHFHLLPNDVEIIEAAIRREIANHTRDLGSAAAKDRVRELNDLLAKLFHQKKFYAHVNETGIPAG